MASYRRQKDCFHYRAASLSARLYILFTEVSLLRKSLESLKILNSWLHTGPPKIQTMCVRVLSKRSLNLVPCPLPTDEEPFLKIHPCMPCRYVGAGRGFQEPTQPCLHQPETHIFQKVRRDFLRHTFYTNPCHIRSLLLGQLQQAVQGIYNCWKFLSAQCDSQTWALIRT